MTSAHSDLIETNLHRPFNYEQDADPGAVGAGKYWLDTSSGPPRLLWRRNALDSGWDAVGGSGGGGAATQIDETGGPTTLDIAAIADGEYLRRSGTDIIGDTPSGGTGKFDPDDPPGSPNAADDEFNDDTNMSGPVNGLDAKWAWRNQSTATITFPHIGNAKLTIPASASASYRILEQAVAAGNFSFACKCSLQAQAADFAGVGLVVIDRTNADFYLMGIEAHVIGTANPVLSIINQRWTSPTVFSAILNAAHLTGSNVIYFRIDRVSTTINFYYSFDGLAWIFMGTLTDTVNVNGVGIAVSEQNNTGLTAGWFNWFRRLS